MRPANITLTVLLSIAILASYYGVCEAMANYEDFQQLRVIKIF